MLPPHELKNKNFSHSIRGYSTAEVDDYIDPSTEAFLENEDYEGLEDGVFDDEPAGQKGASPLNFFS